MARLKKTTIQPPLNEYEANRVMETYAKADAKKDMLAAKMDEEITAIRAKYSEELQECTETTDKCFNKMQAYAECNPDLFGKKKSYETPYGIIGFRSGTPKLKATKGYTLKAALKLLEKNKATNYLRTKIEMAKDILIAERNKPEVISLMGECGLEVTQDNTFFVELKKEELVNG
ncbi:host-nuclease inhibitor Gam family protein [Tenacibaculum maritimum]|uniref:host-nuclease inhibitor Gam family protein n=1 Tax=Tenacibaculum maritimum TaxID=107401 RepID=UPI000413CE71|nr:host-nuclease inhibitor Gam family protein [Tenacibaculum maritimum]